MHQVLAIAEIRAMVFAYLLEDIDTYYDSSASRMSLLLTCTTLCYEALPYFWQCVRSFQQIMNLFPSDAFTVKQVEPDIHHVSITRALTVKDWNGFDRYAPMVKYLDVGSTNQVGLRRYQRGVPLLELLETMAASRPGGPWFPNLEGLKIRRSGVLKYASVICGPKLALLDFHAYAEERTGPDGTFSHYVLALAKAHPALRHLRIEASSVRGIFEMVSHLQISSLELARTCHAAFPPLLQNVDESTGLRSLQLDQVFENACGTRMNQQRNFFSSLEHLVLQISGMNLSDAWFSKPMPPNLQSLELYIRDSSHSWHEIDRKIARVLLYLDAPKLRTLVIIDHDQRASRLFPSRLKQANLQSLFRFRELETLWITSDIHDFLGDVVDTFLEDVAMVWPRLQILTLFGRNTAPRFSLARIQHLAEQVPTLWSIGLTFKHDTADSETASIRSENSITHMHVGTSVVKDVTMMAMALRHVAPNLEELEYSEKASQKDWKAVQMMMFGQAKGPSMDLLRRWTVADSIQRLRDL